MKINDKIISIKIMKRNTADIYFYYSKKNTNDADLNLIGLKNSMQWTKGLV